MCIGQEILLVSPVTVVSTLFELAVTESSGSPLPPPCCGSWVDLCWLWSWGWLLRSLGGIGAAEGAPPPLCGDHQIHSGGVLCHPRPYLGLLPESVRADLLPHGIPVIYTNVLDGISQMDGQLLEMAQVFDIPFGRRLRSIYVSQVLPYFRAGCSLALGLCWKAGVAAEVIGIPQDSIGENLYNAKIYLDTPRLFAWTLVIICISVLFEKGFLKAVDCLVRRLERMG